MKTPQRFVHAWLVFTFALLGFHAGPDLYSQQRSDSAILRGHVTNATGAALARANVSVTGTALSAVTDDDGMFYLPGVPAGAYEVVVSHLGYPDQRASVTFARGGVSRQDFALGG